MKNLLSTLLLFCTFLLSAQDLSTLIQTEMENNNIPGLAVGMVKDGALVWQGTFGYADIENNIPVSEDTPFMLASVSKHFVYCAAMIAIEQGHINSLDDPINQYLPWTLTHPLFPNSVITLRMLLNHVAGIQDNWDVMPYLDNDNQTQALGDYLEDYLLPSGSIYNQNLNFYTETIGTTYHYSNIGYALAGYVIEVATGAETFGQYCQEHIFERLCMSQSSFFFDDLEEEEIAIPYSFSNSTFNAIGHYSYNDYPSGRLRSSLRDMANYAITLLEEGTMDDITILQASNTNFLVNGHSGGDQGVATILDFNQATKEGVIVLSNTGGNINNIINLLRDNLDQYSATQEDELPCHNSTTSTTFIETTKEDPFASPNPSSESIFIKPSFKADRLRIYSTIGVLIADLSIKNDNTLVDISSYEKGVYLLQLSNNHKSQSQLIIKE